MEPAGCLVSCPDPRTVLSSVVCSRLNRSSSWTSGKKRSYWRYLKRSVLGTPAPPYKRVAQTGDPVLRGHAQLVPPERIRHPETQALLKRMTQVMRSCGCVGLSAPQLGVPLRVMVLELPEHLYQMVPPDVREISRNGALPSEDLH
ncbi:unnamed protein product [Staurois parvus]|uniref:Peptide deformylase n=1 Tax=Staurois parvus TaxID=386267 RepID=A0ABN9FP79_9NEOB|nr:unnamed protein product [Staurois parvus]